MQCFCYIMFDHLWSYTCDGIARDPHRLSDFLRGCQRLPKNVQRVMKIPREKEGGKTNIVCVYIYIWLPLGGEVAKEKKQKKIELLPSPSPPMYIASPWWQVAKGCQRMSREPWRSPGKRKEEKQTQCVYTLGERWPRKGSHFFLWASPLC